MHKELTNKQIREQREFETLFKNPKHARAMWSQQVIDRWAKPAMEPIMVYDAKGVLTEDSQIQLAVWEHLKKELEAQGLDRLPTDGEMMEACQAYYSRSNTGTYVARRDSMGAKPVDESKQIVSNVNPLENLTDEQLEVMQQALLDLDKKKYLETDDDNSGNTDE